MSNFHRINKEENGKESHSINSGFNDNRLPPIEDIPEYFSNENELFPFMMNEQSMEEFSDYYDDDKIEQFVYRQNNQSIEPLNNDQSLNPLPHLTGHYLPTVIVQRDFNFEQYHGIGNNKIESDCNLNYNNCLNSNEINKDYFFMERENQNIPNDEFLELQFNIIEDNDFLKGNFSNKNNKINPKLKNIIMNSNIVQFLIKVFNIDNITVAKELFDIYISPSFISILKEDKKFGDKGFDEKGFGYDYYSGNILNYAFFDKIIYGAFRKMLKDSLQLDEIDTIWIFIRNVLLNDLCAFDNIDFIRDRNGNDRFSTYGGLMHIIRNLITTFETHKHRIPFGNQKQFKELLFIIAVYLVTYYILILERNTILIDILKSGKIITQGFNKNFKHTHKYYYSYDYKTKKLIKFTVSIQRFKEERDIGTNGEDLPFTVVKDGKNDFLPFSFQQHSDRQIKNFNKYECRKIEQRENDREKLQQMQMQPPLQMQTQYQIQTPFPIQQNQFNSQFNSQFNQMGNEMQFPILIQYPQNQQVYQPFQIQFIPQNFQQNQNQQLFQFDQQEPIQQNDQQINLNQMNFDNNNDSSSSNSSSSNEFPSGFH